MGALNYSQTQATYGRCAKLGVAPPTGCKSKSPPVCWWARGYLDIAVWV